MIVIDGSFGEGGGQMLREALAFSSIFNIPFRIINIRHNRDPKGMKTQHVYTARAVRKICRGDLEGDEIGSEELIFWPGKFIGGKYKIKIPTAASAILLAQTIIPILLFSNKKSEVEIEGGTFNPFAPTYDYFEHVYLKALSLIGLDIKAMLIKPGYFPEGGGRIKLSINPIKKDIKPFNIKRKESKPRAIIRISNLPMHIAIREKKVLLEHNIENVDIIEDHYGKGNVVLIYDHLRGAIGFGKKGLRAEQLMEQTIQAFFMESGAVDRHLADQLMIFSTLFGGRFTTSKITKHMESNVYIIEKFFNIKWEINKEKNVEIKINKVWKNVNKTL